MGSFASCPGRSRGLIKEVGVGVFIYKFTPVVDHGKIFSTTMKPVGIMSSNMYWPVRNRNTFDVLLLTSFVRI